jgi:hypothetical protein
MAALFDRLEADHMAFIARQRIFFVATATDGAHSNVSPKGYDTLRVLGTGSAGVHRLAGSGNQTARMWRSTGASP